MCVFILSLPLLISPPHPCGCCHGWEFYDVRKLCVHTRNGKCFQREHIQIQPTNRQLMNFTSQNTQKTLTHSHTHMHMEKERDRERDTPTLRNKNNSFSFVIVIPYSFPRHLISLAQNANFSEFFFFCALSFPSGFSFLSLLCEYKLFLFSFSRTELHVVYLYFNMGQIINCCWWLDIVREPEKSIHASAFTQTKHWNYSTITLFLIAV